MPVIYCKLNLFDAKQRVLLVDDVASSDLGAVEMKDLGDTIASICNEENVYSVRIEGNKSYAESIAEDIQSANAFKYHSNHNIEVEVI